METRFQTSFIPKKTSGPAGVMPSTSLSKPPHDHLSGLFMDIAVVIFILSLLSIGGAYAWTDYLQSAQNQYKSELQVREQQFNLSLIQSLQLESVKMRLAEQVLGSHIAASQIFGIVQAMTDEYVRFSSMSLTVTAQPTSEVTLALSGYGRDLSTIAFQSSVLNSLDQYGLGSLVKNPILSSPVVGSNGYVNFTFTASIDPSNLTYKKEVAGSVPGGQAASSTAPASIAPVNSGSSSD